jgi:flagellar hook-associated protein 1 FlgK
VALLGASFQIGRSALAAYQSAIAITGQNIANVGNPDYTRLSGRLTALEGGMTLGGIAPGGGVNLSALERHVDAAVEARLRLSASSLAGSQATYNVLNQIEALYNELSDYDLSTQLSTFFNGFSDLQNDPDEITARNLVLDQADAVISTLRRQRATLLQQATDLNTDIEQGTQRANEIANELASLNEEIVTQEARGPGFSAPLRDRRDALLRELSELMDIQVRERDNGAINVYVGSEPLVEFNRSRGLEVQTELSDGLFRATIRFADNHGTVVISDGSLAAKIQARDKYLVGQVRSLDQLARGLIYEVNRVHSTGCGLVGYTSITGTYAVNDPLAALNSAAAGLTFPINNGSFIVHVRNRDSGETITRQIEVDMDGIGTDTSLESLAQQLDNVPNLSAGITPDGRLELDAGSGYEMWFSEDSSGALAALGVGTFFSGTDAATIDINATLRGDARLLAASLTGEAGDGGNAGRLAVLGTQSSALLANQGIQDFQAMMVNTVASSASAAATAQEAADAVHSGLVAQREAVSGVSLDEEAINLTTYERAYQGAARYFDVLNVLTTEVLNLVSTG